MANDSTTDSSTPDSGAPKADDSQTDTAPPAPRIFTLPVLLQGLCHVLLFVLAVWFVVTQSGGVYRFALLSCLVRNVFRVYERQGIPKLTQQSLDQILREDSTHNIIYAFVAFQQRPGVLFLMGPAALSVIPLCGFLIKIHTAIGGSSGGFIDRQLQKANQKQTQILMVATKLEVAAFFFILFYAITRLYWRGVVDLLMYTQFIALRCISRRSGVRTRAAWHGVQLWFEHWLNHPRCPASVRGAGNKALQFVSSGATKLIEANYQQQA